MTHDRARQRPAHDERNEQAADAAPGDHRRGGHGPEEEHDDEKPQCVCRRLCPVEHAVPAAHDERLPGEHPADGERSTDHQAGRDRHEQRVARAVELLRGADHPREDPCTQSGDDAQRDCAPQIAKRDAPHGLDLEQRGRTVHRDEGEVSRGTGHQGRQQHPPRQVALIRHLEREHSAGRRGLEDGRHAGGGPGHEQQTSICAAKRTRVAALQGRAKGGSCVQGRPLEPHWISCAQRGDRREHPHCEGFPTEVVIRLVERTEVLVRGRRAGPRAEASDAVRHEQADSREHPDQQRRPRENPVEQHVHDQSIKGRNHQTRQCSGDRSEQHHLVGASGE